MARLPLGLSQHEIMRHLPMRHHDAPVGIGRILPVEPGQQALLDAKHRVGMDKGVIGVIGVEDMGGQALIARGRQDIMQMGRAVGVAAKRLSSPPTGPSAGIG